jgi:hypothetical protein
VEVAGVQIGEGIMILKSIGFTFLGFVASYILGIPLPPEVLAVVALAGVSLVFRRQEV